MPAPFTVDEMIDQVRDAIDEDSTATISDSDILESLNRAQDFAADILARHYKDPLLTYTTIDTVNAQYEYDLPEGIFEDRIAFIEVLVPSSNNHTYPMDKIQPTEAYKWETNTAVAIPTKYLIHGRTLRLPTPSSVYAKYEMDVPSDFMLCCFVRRPELSYQ